MVGPSKVVDICMHGWARAHVLPIVALTVWNSSVRLPIKSLDGLAMGFAAEFLTCSDFLLMSFMAALVLSASVDILSF